MFLPYSTHLRIGNTKEDESAHHYLWSHCVDFGRPIMWEKNGSPLKSFSHGNETFGDSHLGVSTVFRLSSWHFIGLVPRAKQTFALWSFGITTTSRSSETYWWGITGWVSCGGPVMWVAPWPFPYGNCLPLRRNGIDLPLAATDPWTRLLAN